MQLKWPFDVIWRVASWDFVWTNGRSWVTATWNTSSYWRMPHIHPGIRSCSWDFPRKNMLLLAKDYGRGHFSATKVIQYELKYCIISIYLYIYCTHRNTSKWKMCRILLNILEQLSSQAASGDLWDSLLLRCFCAHGFAWDASYAELHSLHSETRRLGGDMVMALQSTLPDVPHTCWGKYGSNITTFFKPILRVWHRAVLEMCPWVFHSCMTRSISKDFVLVFEDTRICGKICETSSAVVFLRSMLGWCI